MSFGTWNLRSLYSSGSLMTAARELAKCKLDLVGIQEVMWDKEGILRAGEYAFFYGKGQENHQLRAGLFVHQRIVSAIKRVEFVSDRMSYIVLRGRWCNIVVLNAHAPTEEKGDNSKDCFYEELGEVFNHFLKYHMKILLGDLNTKVGKKDTSKPTIGNESLHQVSNDNCVRIVNFATSKNLIFNITMFRTETFINTPGPLLMGRLIIRSITY
jgi:exonuclease III